MPLPRFLLAAFIFPYLTGLVPGQQKLDDLIEAERAARGIPGLSVTIGAGGKILYEGAFGMADLEQGVKVTPKTRFRTASIAKPMTAVAVMQLAAAGKLDIDMPIRRYCKEFPKKRWEPTARQLMGHLGGVRHYKFSGEARGTKFFGDLASTVGLFAKDPLRHEPGAKYLYTTFGFTLLGRAVETASEKSYGRYMEESVFAPAGMKDTVLDTHLLIIPNRARGYQKLSRRAWLTLGDSMKGKIRPGELMRANLHDTSMKVPGGGLLSTASDLVRFGMAMQQDELLVSAEQRELMWTRQKTADGKPTSYGLGFGVRVRNGKRVRVSHSGGQAGTSCLMIIEPTEGGRVYAFMSNLRGANIGELAKKVIQASRKAIPE